MGVERYGFERKRSKEALPGLCRLNYGLQSSIELHMPASAASAT